MAKNTYKSNTFKKADKEKRGKSSSSGFSLTFLKDQRLKLAVGFILIFAGLYMFFALLSYMFTGQADFSEVGNHQSMRSIVEALREKEISNWLGLYGAIISHFFIFRWFGISSFFIPPLLFLLGFKIVFKREIIRISSYTIFAFFSIVWLCLMLGYMVEINQGGHAWQILGGGFGLLLAQLSYGMFGWGTFLILVLTLFIFIIFYFNVTAIPAFPYPNPKPMGSDAILEGEEPLFSGYTDDEDKWVDKTQGEAEGAPVRKMEQPEAAPELQALANGAVKLDVAAVAPPPKKEAPKPEPEFIVEERLETDEIAEHLVQEHGEYDPTLELSSYKFPTLDLLNEYDSGKAGVTQDELNQNKDKIVATLVNFKIGIQSIKATIGPTVTLYEIVPDAGIKISRIKNLEDDIALSLSALGIRIIAPIPGKGTIGIEVPNKNREMVSIRSMLASPAFAKTDKELPVALGKTISNEALIIDLAKMPHLLVAGATGQGKSVGLNVLLTSLIYKRHPSQLKFVLVDPKKVEMSLYSKLERHYLAKLPNSEEAIITDTRKVVHTLNSLCIEMENRYEILKDAGARNLKEYNAKFVARKLNPKEGHRFLPYIVLVIDELADLMMTAGKEVETPIARLAQLARAIGIHLVVATQRPSVNVITGVIKANFPARLSFRVTSKVDSRTILDTGGADQLVGQGDMLLSSGSDIIRLQCPFVDTPEIDKVCDFIGSQRGYDSAYLLPEYEGDDESGANNVDLSDRDALFEDAARVIVMHQQGSTSLIQRKLKLGYNRAGRLIDQLEAAGVVGPFEGSKAREVLIKDEISLEQLLNALREKHSQP
ncbi:MAG TPA: DNA translocase FtsK 4TM domain-containing protein [Chryseosolibacter sp.]|nr:DNA translocase FtsK 4TM domain-containing protein [Chryseosolibacter sp.]